MTMLPALKIARITHEEDVFAADETKVHTMSHQVISEMLETAERQEAASSAPPPASGVRKAEGSRPAPTKSGMMPKIPRPAALPAVSYDEDDEGLEPTILSERASAISLPRQELVTQLMAEPPKIIETATPSTPPDQRETLPEIVPVEIVAIENVIEQPIVVAPTRFRIDRRAIAITIATFVATLLPALVLLQHLMAR